MLGPTAQNLGVYPLVVEPRRLDLAASDTLRGVWDLQRAAYTVEAELIGFDGIPPLHESLQELRNCGESFLGLDDDTGLAAAVSWTRLQDGTLDICRLMVHPRAHRRGFATALLDSLDRLEPATRAVVATGTANRPALALYQRRGFTPTGTRQIGPTTTVTLLERRDTPSTPTEGLPAGKRQRSSQPGLGAASGPLPGGGRGELAGPPRRCGDQGWATLPAPELRREAAGACEAGSPSTDIRN